MASESVHPLGRLRNGNPAAPVEAMQAAPRCGARTRAGTPCKRAACRGRTRCPLHGGKSTGPRTPEGRERARLANLRHGERTQAAMVERRERAALLREARRLFARLTKSPDRWTGEDLAEIMSGRMPNP